MMRLASVRLPWKANLARCARLNEPPPRGNGAAVVTKLMKGEPRRLPPPPPPPPFDVYVVCELERENELDTERLA